MARVSLTCLVLIATASHAASIQSQSKETDSIESVLGVAQCRARCLRRFSSDGSQCLQGPDCFMCWENCALLQSNYAIWGAMCSVKRLCFPGCQEACQFHREMKTQRSLHVIRTHVEDVLNIEAGAARWCDSPTPSMVYVLMARPKGSSSWLQISQSIDCEVRLESSSVVFSPETSVRVLVVDAQGLLTIYNKKMMEIKTTAAPTLNDHAKEPWRPTKVSLTYQRDSASAEVSWTPRDPNGVYRVTWELDGGVLKGNLFTDSTSATLSLWPDAINHVQVELVSRSSRLTIERSEILIIDTRKAAKVDRPAARLAEPLEAVPTDGNRRFLAEILAGTGTALFVFLLLVIFWRYHRARRLKTSLADDSLSADASIINVRCADVASDETVLRPSSQE